MDIGVYIGKNTDIMIRELNKQILYGEVTFKHLNLEKIEDNVEFDRILIKLDKETSNNKERWILMYERFPDKFVENLDDIIDLSDRYIFNEKFKDISVNGVNTIRWCQIIGNNLTSSVIVKPVNAHGSDESHKIIYRDKNEDINLGYPYVIQEYILNTGVLYKIYVIGENIYINRRKSELFDKLSGLIRRDDEVINLENIRDDLGYESLVELVRKIGEMCDINFYGIDLILGETGVYYVIDINHFPSYKNILDKYLAIANVIIEKIR